METLIISIPVDSDICGITLCDDIRGKAYNSLDQFKEYMLSKNCEDFSYKNLVSFTNGCNYEQVSLDDEYISFIHLNGTPEPSIKEKYLKKSSQCPYCDSDDIEGGPVDIDSGQALQDIICNSCDHEWTDIYSLGDVEFKGKGCDHD